MEPSRKLGAQLSSRQELIDVIQAALNGELAFLPFDAPPPGSARYPVRLTAPGVEQTVELIAQIAGDPMGTTYPVVLMPTTSRQADKLRVLAETLAAAAPSADEAPQTETRRSQEFDLAEDEFSRASGTVSRPPEEDQPDLAGRQLGGGRYRIEKLLGVGGMGRVYLAQQVSLAKPVAIKVLDSSFASDPLFTARFHQEALAASQLDHRNAMSVLDFGEEPDGLLFIAMELLEGESLAHVLAREPKLPPDRVLPIMTQICAALAAAHERGIVHRDIKPENIVISRRIDDDGRAVEFVKVCDFGLAKMQVDEEQPTRTRNRKLTMAGQVMGTPDYMAPEQCRGEAVDARADVYACGIVLFELLTGRIPFEAENPMEVLGLHIMAKPPRPRALEPTLDPRLEATILRALEKEPDARHQTIREFRDELRAVGRSPAAQDSIPGPRSAPTMSVDESPFFGGSESSPKITPVPYVADPTAQAPTPGRPGHGSSGQHRLDGLARQLDFGDEEMSRPSHIPIDMDKAPASLKAAGATPASSMPPSAAQVEALAQQAHAALGEDAALRKASYRRLLEAGISGFWALQRARSGVTLDEDRRRRWVNIIRDFAQRGMAAVPFALSQLDLNHPAGIDDALAEDLLQALPVVKSAEAAEQAHRFVAHSSPLIRRAALTALTQLAPADIGKTMLRALDDRDGGVRLLVTRAYRKSGKVGPPETEKLIAIMNDADAPDEVRASAAFALARVHPSAQAEAEVALLHAIEGTARSPSFVRMFSGRTREDGPLFLEAAAKVLLRLSGPEVKSVIRKRARSVKGEARERLERLLAAG